MIWGFSDAIRWYRYYYYNGHHKLILLAEYNFQRWSGYFGPFLLFSYFFESSFTWFCINPHISFAVSLTFSPAFIASYLSSPLVIFWCATPYAFDPYSLVFPPSQFSFYLVVLRSSSEDISVMETLDLHCNFPFSSVGSCGIGKPEISFINYDKKRFTISA